MKSPVRFNLIMAILILAATFSSIAQDTTGLSPDIKPLPILTAMQRVADWQLAHPSTNNATDWAQGAGYAGFMALAGISGDAKYRDAMLAMAESNQWQLLPNQYNCMGQAYAELYLLYRDPKMIAPLRAQFDTVHAKPPASQGDDWSRGVPLFTEPPTWMRLYAATDDERYMDFALTYWSDTTNLNHDNGWAMAGLVRTLQYLPMNHPDRPRLEQLFKDTANAVLTSQQPDGLWHNGQSDPTGSGFLAYALAWGVNQGLLDRAKFQPAVEKAWTALVGGVDPDGKLANADSTDSSGLGAFLLAGSEVYRMAVMEVAKPIIRVQTHFLTDQKSSAGCIAVKVTNPSPFHRDCETVQVCVGSMCSTAISPIQTLHNIAVMDGVSSRILDSQTYLEPDAANDCDSPQLLLFQVDLAPGETRTYYLLDGSALAAVPPSIVKTFARYVPERYDDFAWESDRIAHRTYGKALETSKEPLTSSGMDVWIKRDRELIVNEMYRSGDNYNQSKPSQDDYKVGKTRGCGGLGIWQDGTLHSSANWRNYKMITTGPIRSEFELTYDAWDVNGQKISETKRISIDAGSNMSRMESIFASDNNSPLQIGVGLAERPGENVIVPDGSSEIDSWTNTTARGLAVQNQEEGWMAYWQPQDFYKGTIGDAIVLPKNTVELFTNDLPNLPASAFMAPTNTIQEGQPARRNLLAIAPAKVGQPFVYYMGAGWTQSGDFTNAVDWDNYIRRFAERRDEPLKVSVSGN